MKLSIIIPTWKDPELFKTINSLLNNSQLDEGQLEIITVFDGYSPEIELHSPIVKYVHLGKNQGMREAINAGISASSGNFIMKTDAHCMFAPGFDKIMVESCQSDWVMTSLRYTLDINKWENFEGEPTGYEQLLIVDNKRFAGVRWRRRDRERKNIMIDENMAMQGSCWFMSREWWDKVVSPLQTEGYGPLMQESTEILFKTWKAGGKLMLNKNTWYSHKHRSFGRTHGIRSKDSWEYSLNLWRDYYEKEIKPKWSI